MTDEMAQVVSGSPSLQILRLDACTQPTENGFMRLANIITLTRLDFRPPLPTMSLACLTCFTQLRDMQTPAVHITAENVTCLTRLSRLNFLYLLHATFELSAGPIFCRVLSLMTNLQRRSLPRKMHRVFPRTNPLSATSTIRQCLITFI
jgi:hypothetical protein